MDFWTGDDWHPQQNQIVSPKYGCLPNFKGPDLPSPRTPFRRIQVHTPENRKMNPPPVISPLKLKIKPVTRIRVSLVFDVHCVHGIWNFNRLFIVRYPNQSNVQRKPPAPNQFATMMRSLIEEGRVTRRQLGETLIGNHRGGWIQRRKGRKSQSSVPDWL